MNYSLQKKHFKTLNRRTFFLLIIKLSLFTILGLRLFNIQILNSKKYKTLSENNQINLGTINPGQIVTSENSVQISASTSVINGSIINIPVVYNTSTGFTTNSVISVQVGAITVNDPVGPDSHGYYIYDIGDTGYQLAPEYDWIEIDPDYGGNGDEVNVYDGGNNQDDVTTIS